MLIESIEKELKNRFPQVDFDFSLSRLPQIDLESNIFFVLQDKEKLGLEELKSKYEKDLEDILSKFGMDKKDFEISSSGFLNINLSPEVLKRELKNILDKKENYFRSHDLNGKKINLEFVSANPTGPLHLGNLRGGPTGEVLTNLLKQRGAKVIKEYYVNDLGTQTERFAKSVIFHKISDEKKYRFPEDGYKGNYPKQIAQKLGNEEVSNFISGKIDEKQLIDVLRRLIMNLVLKEIKNNLKELKISFDNFIFESSLVDETKFILSQLKEKKVVKEREGALWFSSPKHKELLGDRECVLIRSDGKPTYFLYDIAYHINKFKRGFDFVIDIWGANHFGHAPRIWAALEILDYSRENLKIIFYQPVSLKKGSKALMMSKRQGSYITVSELLEGIDKDIFKVYLLEKILNSPIDFDPDQFEKEKKESLAFYLKYMSARINGIFEKVKEPKGEADFSDLDQSAIKLIKKILFLDYMAYRTTEILEPHLFYNEAMALVEAFHSFYEKNPIKNEKDEKIKKARFEILKATNTALQFSSKMLGIDLPKKM